MAATLPSIPTFKAAGTSQSGTGALTVAWPTHVTNDYAVMVVVSQNETISLTTANGFAAVGSQQNSTGATLPASLAVYVARATSGAMASPVIAANTLNKYARIYTFSGVAKDATGYDISAGGTNNSAGTTSPSIATATTAQQLDLVVAICAYEVLSTTPQASAPTNANLSSVTLRGDESTVLGGGAAVITGGWSAGGAYGATTLTLANSSKVACCSLALKPQWTVDQASGKVFPAGTNEWTDFLAAAPGCSNWSAPTMLWAMQEASGNPADSIGSITLTAGAGLGYAGAVSGYTRKGLTYTDASTSANAITTSTSLPDVSVTSFSIMSVISFGATTPSAAHQLFTMGTTRAALECTTGPVLRARSAGNSTNATENPKSTVFPASVKIDRTNSVVTAYTALTKDTPTFGSTMTGKALAFGGQAANLAACTMTSMYACGWSGAAAERNDDDFYNLYTELGWSPSFAVNDPTSMSGAGTVSGSFGDGALFASDMSGAGSVSGSPSDGALFASNWSGSGSASGSLPDKILAASAMSGAGSVSGSPSDGALFTTSMTGAGSVSGSPSDGALFTSNWSGAGSVSGSISDGYLIISGITGSGSVSGSFPDGILFLSDWSGAGSVSGIIADGALFGSDWSGAGSVSGTLDDGALAGSDWSGSGSVSGVMSDGVLFSSDWSGAGSVSGSFPGQIFIVGGNERDFALIRTFKGLKAIIDISQDWLDSFVTDPERRAVEVQSDGSTKPV